MSADEPPTFAAGPAAVADLNTLRDDARWLLGYEPGSTPGSKPFCRVRSSVNVALSNDGDWSRLTFDTNVFDPGEDVMFNGTDALVAPVTGYYLAGACVRTEPTTANKALRIQVNGTTVAQQDNIGVSTPAFTTMNASALVFVNTGEEITADVFQDSGATINAVVEGDTPCLWAAWYAWAPDGF